MIELTVKTLDSRNHSFSVADDFTVKQLKEHIAETVSIPVESQRLIYCGRVLQDEKNLSEYDVNGKVIHLVQRAPPSSNGSGGGGGGGADMPPTQRRPWRNAGNAMYLGAMAIPAEIMDATGIPMQQPRHCLSHSRLSMVRTMLNRAEAVLTRLENPEDSSHAPPNGNGAGPPEPSAEENVTNGNNPGPTVEISPDGIEINQDAGETGADPQQEEARATESTTPPENEQEPGNEGAEGAAGGGTGRQRRSYPNPPMLAELFDRMDQVNARLAPFMTQYRRLLREDPVMDVQGCIDYSQRLFTSVSEIMHDIAHAYHALSDIMCDFSQPPPRSLRCRPVLIHHSAVVHTGIPIQVSASLGAMPANLVGAQSDAASGNGRPGENGTANVTSAPTAASVAAPVTTASASATAASAQPVTTTAATATFAASALSNGANQTRPTPPVAHVAPRMGTVGGGGPGFEFLVDMTPGSITIDSVEAHVVSSGTPPGGSDSAPNNWQNPPEFVQNLISALAGQFMGATFQQFQFPSQQNVGTNTQSNRQNSGTNTQTQTTGSAQTQTTATATQSTGTSTQSANVGTQNTGTSTQNAGISTQNTGSNTQSTGSGANSNSQFQFPGQKNADTNTQSNRKNGATNTDIQTTVPAQTQTTATATQSTGTSMQSANVGTQNTQNTGTNTQNSGISTQNTGTNTHITCSGANANRNRQNTNVGGGGAAGQASTPGGGAQTRGDGRQVHVSPHNLSRFGFDPFLPCNSHHIRGGRGRSGRPSNGSNAQASAPPPPPPRSVPVPVPSSISITLGAGSDPVISVEALRVPAFTSGASASPRNAGNQQNAENQPTAGSQPLNFPQELIAMMHALRSPVTGLQERGGSPNPTLAQIVLNPGYTYVAGESVVLDICMTLAQSLTLVDVIQLGLGQSECLGRARPQLRQLIGRLGGDPARLVDRLNAELRMHYAQLENVRLREDIDLPASVSRYNQRMLADIINFIMDENQPLTSFHRNLVRKCALYVNHLCALLQYCCIDANGFESLLRACVNRVTSGVPPALQEWTTASSMEHMRSFISSAQAPPPDEIQQYVVFRATSPQPATAPAPAAAPASQPPAEPMDTHDVEEEFVPALDAAVPPTADDVPSARVNDVIGWPSALPSDWVPIITRDTQRQRRQSPQGPFSDAYLSGMPSKRRKLISSAKPQGNLSQVISESMATALNAAGMSSGPEVEVVAQRAGQDSSMRAAYREQVRATLGENLDNNPDFVPEKYPNATKYFDKK